MSTTTETPAAILEDAVATAERIGLGIDVREGVSDLPGFRYFELVGKVDVCGACGAAEAEPHSCTLEERSLATTEVRLAGRLSLTLEGGRRVELDATETADVMWALANSTRRNRKAAAHGNNPEREARFARQVAVMAKINDAPTV